MQPEDTIRLRHMLDTAKKAVEFTKGKIITKDLPDLIARLEKLILQG